MANTLHTIFGNAKIDPEGYYRITSSKEGNYNRKLHRLIYERFWDVTYGLEWVELCEVKIES